MSYNFNSGYGQALLNMVASQVPAFGNVFIVMNAANTDEGNFKILQDVFPPDPDGRVRFYTSLLAAYTAAESNNNDVILLDANTEHALAEQLVISKNRIHFIGMDSGGRLHGQGAKVNNTDGTAAASVIKVTGTRNTFRNIKFIQIDDDATSQGVLIEAGESTLYKNCSFIFGVDDELDQTDTYEVLLSGDSTEFHECTFGADTLVTTAGRAVMAFDVVTTAAKSNIFKDCIWNILTTTADAHFVRVVATTDLHFGHLFINPIFLATISNALSGITVDDAVESKSGLNAGNILMINPATNATSLAGTNADNLKVVALSMADSGDADVTNVMGIGRTPS